MTSIQACSNMINQKPVLKAQRLDGDSILLTWDKIDHADGYILYRATKRNGTYYKIAHKSKKITSYSDHKDKQGQYITIKCLPIMKIMDIAFILK